MKAPPLVGSRRRARTPSIYSPADRVVQLILSMLLVGSLMACATTGLTLNDAQAAAYSSTTFARQACTALLRAKKNNLAADQKCQADVSVFDLAIASATTVAQVQAARAQADAFTTANGGTPPK